MVILIYDWAYGKNLNLCPNVVHSMSISVDETINVTFWLLPKQLRTRLRCLRLIRICNAEMIHLLAMQLFHEWCICVSWCVPLLVCIYIYIIYIYHWCNPLFLLWSCYMQVPPRARPVSIWRPSFQVWGHDCREIFILIRPHICIETISWVRGGLHDFIEITCVFKML